MNKEELTKGFAERIKLLRGEMSQSKFASLFKVHRNTILRYESADGVPDGLFLEALCAYYDIHPAWLLMGEGPMRKGDNALPPVKPVAAVDESLLESVIEAVEEYLNSERLTLAPTKKAQLIAALYGLSLSEKEKKVDKAVVIRLAKLAA